MIFGWIYLIFGFLGVDLGFGFFGFLDCHDLPLASLAMTGNIVILSKAKYLKKHNADNILDISPTLNMTE